MDFEIAVILACLCASLWLKPWRMLMGTELLTPLLATLVLLPWLWALPSLHNMPLQLHWSGAPLVTLMLGWPLAVLVLVGVGVVTHFISSLTPSLLRSNRDRTRLLTKFTSTIWNTSKQNDTTLRAT